MPAARLLPLLVLALMLAGCMLARFEQADGEPQVPDEPIQHMGDEPTGPVTVLETGLDEEVGWRFVTYESDAGLCLQVETITENGGSAASGCGLVEQADQPLTQVGAGSGADGIGHIQGIAGPAVAGVWIETDGGGRLPARLHGLKETGIDAQAFFILVPTDADPSSVVAVDAEGRELGRSDVSHAFR